MSVLVQDLLQNKLYSDNTNLATINIIQNKIQFVMCLERVVQTLGKIKTQFMIAVYNGMA